MQRQDDGILEPFPIWSDIRAFDGRPWAGCVDIITAGVPCFAAGTLVLAREGYRGIESLVVGDTVLTHTGKWKPITAVMVRYAAELRSVRAGGTTNIVTTDEHQFYARRRQGREWRGRGESYTRCFSDPEWRHARELTTADFVAQILPPVRSDDRAPAFWYVVGRYLADGWRVDRPGREGRGRVVICACHTEADALAGRISAAGFHATRSGDRTVVKFIIYQTEFFAFLEQFGRLAHGKRIPGFVYELDQERATALLDGYLDGDGYTEERWEDRRATTVSRSLALGVALLAQRAYGVVAGVRRCAMPSTTIIEGRTVNQRDFYVVSIPPRNRSAFVEGNMGWKRVTGSDRCGSGTVYNIAVEEDESYMVEGCIVHNCQPWSVAGKRGGEGDKRNLWPEVWRIARDVRPRYVFLENVPGLIAWNGGAYFGVILGELAALGFSCEWGVLGADDVGAPHIRKRIWIVGNAEEGGCGAWRARGSVDASARESEPERALQATHAERGELRHEPWRICGTDGAGSTEPRDYGAQGRVADADAERRDRRASVSQASGSGGRLSVEGGHAWSAKS